MSDHGVTGVIELPIYIENDFEVDEDGVCSILTIIFAGEDDDAQEFRVNLEHLVDDIIDWNRDEGYSGYQQLYSIAHEFTRHAARLREIAVQLEDSDLHVGDLFDIDLED